MIASILIGSRYHPRRCVRDTLIIRYYQKKVIIKVVTSYQVEHFPLSNDMMKGPHYFFNAGVPVPPMYIKQVNVRGPQFLQGCFQGYVQGFSIVSSVHDFLLNIGFPTLEVGGVLYMMDLSNHERIKGKVSPS